MSIKEKFVLKRKMSAADKDIKNFCLGHFEKLSIAGIQKRIKSYKNFKDIHTMIQHIQKKDE